MQALFQLQQATLAARARCGDRSIGTDVRAGLVRVVRAQWWDGGDGSVKPLTKPVPVAEAIEALNNLQPSR